MSRLLLLAIPIAAVGLGDASAQDARTDDVVVTGRVESARERARQVAQRISVPVNGQLPRFREPVCPTVSGLSEPYAAMVARRIRTVATDVGLDAAKPGCVPNLLVVVVDDGRGFVAGLRRSFPSQFAGVDRAELERLLHAPGPARSWSVLSVRNKDGRPASRAQESGDSVAYGAKNTNIGFGSGANVLPVPDVSILNPGTQQVLDLSYVVLETRATLGKPLMQLADYAAMRGLARTRPSELRGTEDTILRLFEASAAPVPARLTPTDHAYLEGLYFGSATRSGASQIASIVTRIVRTGDED